jgi:hypothetical protein
MLEDILDACKNEPGRTVKHMVLLLPNVFKRTEYCIQCVDENQEIKLLKMTSLMV